MKGQNLKIRVENRGSKDNMKRSGFPELERRWTWLGPGLDAPGLSLRKARLDNVDFFFFFFNISMTEPRVVLYHF